jgi:DNA-binding protein HU-beta
MAEVTEKKYASSIDLAKKLEDALALKTKAEGKLIVKAFKESISELLAAKGELRIDGVGTFRTSVRKPRVGVNPRTGEKVNIPELTVVSFRTGKKLRQAVSAK